MKILIAMGTRPEGVKFAPLIKALQSDPFFNVRVCVSGQHQEMLSQVLDFFDIKPDYDLKLMVPNQTLYDISASCLLGLRNVLEDFNPEIVFVQGDTTTALIGALAAFYQKIKVAHLEAGLRSGDKYAPFPEEVNRKLISTLADYHFAPTSRARSALVDENITTNVWVVGNTVIDALILGLQLLKTQQLDFTDELPYFNRGRTILLTAHRRESFGKALQNICLSILEIVNKYPNLQILYPVHYNPNVRKQVYKLLNDHPQIHLINPLDYPKLIWAMKKCDIIVTDSGGIQEEAPALGKPVLVLRNVTERMEGIEAGTAKLVGTDKQVIIRTIDALLNNQDQIYDRMSKAVNPYGDGTASKKITSILKQENFGNL